MDEIVIKHTSSPAQRRAIYKYLLGDRERVIELIRSLSSEQAAKLLDLLAQVVTDDSPSIWR